MSVDRTVPGHPPGGPQALAPGAARGSAQRALYLAAERARGQSIDFTALLGPSASKGVQDWGKPRELGGFGRIWIEVKKSCGLRLVRTRGRDCRMMDVTSCGRGPCTEREGEGSPFWCKKTDTTTVS